MNSWSSLTVDGLENSLMAATLEGSGVAPCLVIWWPRKSISYLAKLTMRPCCCKPSLALVVHHVLCVLVWIGWPVGCHRGRRKRSPSLGVSTSIWNVCAAFMRNRGGVTCRGGIEASENPAGPPTTRWLGHHVKRWRLMTIRTRDDAQLLHFPKFVLGQLQFVRR